MSSKACQSCGGTNVEIDSSRGIAVCTDCGVVLEENCIVSEVQFEENAYGGASAIGQFLSTDSQGGTGFINTFRGASGKQSREITLKRARDRITMMGQQLNLNSHCIDVACNFYNMALVRRLTNGRKAQHIVAACIYLTCRMEGTAHLLIDIADVIDIDVYTLGHTFMSIAKVFNLNIPTIDPCMYVMRYANRLEFGDKTHEVSKTALRLVQRMKRDWIHTGRRPSGLCGAALLIAARHHGFNRTVQDVIKEVKVHENTVRKRMLEFGETASSNLTLEEFMTVDLEEEHDPPCFLKSRKKDRTEKVDEGTKDELIKLEKEINRQISQHLAKKKGPWAKHYKESLTNEEDSEEVQDSTEIDASKLGLGTTNDADLDDAIADVTLSAVKECLNEKEAAAVEAATKAVASPPKKSRKTTLSESELMPPPDSTYLQLRHHLRPSLASLGIFDNIDKEVPDKSEHQEIGDKESGELDLEGLDDKELDCYIKSEEEAKATGEVWMALYGETLVELEAKRKKREEEEESRARKGEKRKRKRRAPQSYSANTPGEAIGKMLVGKRISNKIDYEKLKDLGFVFGSPSNSNAPSTSNIAEPVVETTETSSKPRSRAAKVNLSASKSRDTPKEELKPIVSAESPSPPPPPVHEDMYEEEEEEEEEEGVQSVRSLMSTFHGEADTYGEDDYY